VVPPIERGEGWTRSADGTALFWRSWRAPSPRAAVAIVHGLGEHSGRYEHVAAFLAGRGYDCWAGDCRGHGTSPGPRVHVADFTRYVEDAGAFLQLAAAGGGPAFLLGHSQGGLVALLRALRHPEGLTGVVASSPYLAIHSAAAPSGVKLAAASVLLRVAPSFLVASGLDTGVLSHDPQVERDYLADPLVSRKVSPAWLRAAAAAQAELRERASLFAVPALVMSAGEDRLVDPGAIRAWAHETHAAPVAFIEWPGMYHELFNEVGKEKVLERVAGWMDQGS
jgi:alpha-beta hydrolase superfamily lysophospholipase